VKIGDLNVSKLAWKDGLNYTQAGTPYYSSPEVWRDVPYDFKSDVWSLGCVIYEMTCLELPFKASSMNELYKKIIRGMYKMPTNRSYKILEIINSTLVVNAAKRINLCKLCKLPFRIIPVVSLDYNWNGSRLPNYIIAVQDYKI
jgi:NIMA (never in mitosis gene a)-related kinase